MQFATVTEDYAQSAEDFGREFSTGLEQSCVPCIGPRPPKYPTSATRIPIGKGYKFTAENVVVVLRAVMKDVSQERSHRASGRAS